MQALAFLDFDDVVCLNKPYGGYDAFAPGRPKDLFQKLFAPECVEVLRQILAEHDLEVVVTTSWLRLSALAGILDLLRQAGLDFVADRVVGEAFPHAGETRAQVIERWLREQGAGRQFVVLDDVLSGKGIAESPVLRQHAVLCSVDVGLEPQHVVEVAMALDLPGRGCSSHEDAERSC